MRSKEISIFLIFFFYASIDTVNAQFNNSHPFSIRDNNCVSTCGSSISRGKNAPDTSESKVPHFSVILGAGWVSGERIGVRFRINKSWSAETSYGYRLGNFLGLSDLYRKYGLGLNWHSDNPDDVAISLLGAYTVNPNPGAAPPTVSISGNIGLLSTERSTFGWGARIGVFLEIGRDINNALKVRSYGPNLDFEVNWSFF